MTKICTAFYNSRSNSLRSETEMNVILTSDSCIPSEMSLLLTKDLGSEFEKISFSKSSASLQSLS